MTTPRIGLVGYGYWGPNLLRNLIALGGAQVVGVIEKSEAARKKCAELYPHLPLFDDLDAFLAAQKPDAMVIATPPATHQDLAVRCLRAGAHVLVEKPLAMSTAECDVILTEARRAGKQVMVDHTFVYHPAVEYLNERARSGELGELHHYDSVRVNFGGFQPRANALWDLAPHDLSILDLVLKGRQPKTVTCLGSRNLEKTVEHLCYVHLTYDDGFIAHLHLNWVAPVKIRTVTLGGSKRMAIYDENSPTEKIKLYNRELSISHANATPGDFRVSYRMGDMTAPAISGREALAGMIAAFVQSVKTGTPAASDGQAGRRVVAILEAATRSMQMGGQPVELAATPARRAA